MIRGLGRNKTVILSTHILSEVEATCDRVLMVVAGQLHVDETLESFRRGHGVLLRLLGDVPDAQSSLATMEGITDVSCGRGDDGNTVLELKTDARAGLLTTIGNTAAQRGWTVVELTRLHHDLEDIFKKLKSQSTEVVA